MYIYIYIHIYTCIYINITRLRQQQKLAARAARQYPHIFNNIISRLKQFRKEIVQYLKQGIVNSFSILT